jgi:hypothetical protein
MVERRTIAGIRIDPVFMGYDDTPYEFLVQVKVGVSHIQIGRAHTWDEARQLAVKFGGMLFFLAREIPGQLEPNPRGEEYVGYWPPIGR